MYERLADALDMAEEPYEAAREALKAMLEPTSEVLAAGISAEAWHAAIAAMIAAANLTDEGFAHQAAEERRRAWPALQGEFETWGSRLWRPTESKDVWRIEAPPLNVEVDLSSGAIEGIWIGRTDEPFNRLRDEVRSALDQRQREVAQEARKAELRKTHTWDNKRKGWVPKGGIGPVIRGGATA